jgi:hypothetical protein
MSTESVKHLISELAVQLPGCPDNLIMLALRRGARKFCERTGLWQAGLTAAAVAEQAEYTLDASGAGEAQILTVDKVEVNGCEIVKSGYKFDKLTSELVFQAGSIPTVDDQTIAITVSLQPTLDCTDFPTVITGQYSEGISAWAGAYICRLSKRPWFDPAQAVEFDRTYRGVLQDALIYMASEGRDESPGLSA